MRHIPILKTDLFLFTTADSVDEEIKRARTSLSNATNSLYPQLSDLEKSLSQSENEKCCSDTASAHSANNSDDQTNDQSYDEERWADRFYSCLLCLLCIE